MRPWAWVALAAAVCSSPAVQAAPDPPCRATLALDPATAVVGQQVLLRVRIVTESDVARAEWDEPASVDGAWLEWLPDRNGPAGDREIRRAIFPMRDGEIRIPTSHLRCFEPAKTATESIPTEVAVPGATLRVAPLPRSGRPAGVFGTIGPVSLHAVAVPQEIALGETIRVALMVRGEGDLRNLADPLPDLESFEVFRRPPELTLEAGSQLSLVRHFAYDVVPNRAGSLVLPAIRVSYYDPARGRFDSVATEPISVRVGPRAEPVATAIDPGAVAVTEPVDAVPSPPTARRAIGWAAVVAGTVGIGFGAWMARARRERRRRIRDLTAALESQTGGAAANDPAAVDRLLRAGIALCVPETQSLTAEELSALPQLPERVREAVRVLRRVDRARFDPRASMPEREEILRALRSL